MTGLIVLIVALIAATVFGILWQRRSGRVREVSRRHEVVSAANLGVPLGERATLVQFSSAFCQPCRATKVILSEVTAMVPGVAHVEIDAESRLELVRSLDIMRTPTTLFLDGQGAVRKRASGQPRKADVIAALGEYL